MLPGAEAPIELDPDVDEVPLAEVEVPLGDDAEVDEPLGDVADDELGAVEEVLDGDGPVEEAPIVLAPCDAWVRTNSFPFPMPPPPNASVSF